MSLWSDFCSLLKKSTFKKWKIHILQLSWLNMIKLDVPFRVHCAPFSTLKAHKVRQWSVVAPAKKAVNKHKSFWTPLFLTTSYGPGSQYLVQSFLFLAPKNIPFKNEKFISCSCPDWTWLNLMCHFACTVHLFLLWRRTRWGGGVWWHQPEKKRLV